MSTENQKYTTETPSSQGGVIGKCFFVGMHNKPGMKPLDSKTMSGKMIDSIIRELPITCVKTNMCEVDYMPIDDQQVQDENLNWIEKYRPNNDSIIILLGSWVHKNFLFDNAKIIKIPHPASCFGNVNKDNYRKNAIEKIKNQIINYSCKNCKDKNGQNIGNMYVCDKCGRSVS